MGAWGLGASAPAVGRWGCWGLFRARCRAEADGAGTHAQAWAAARWGGALATCSVEEGVPGRGQRVAGGGRVRVIRDIRARGTCRARARVGERGIS